MRSSTAEVLRSKYYRRLSDIYHRAVGYSLTSEAINSAVTRELTPPPHAPRWLNTYLHGARQVMSDNLYFHHLVYRFIMPDGRIVGSSNPPDDLTPSRIYHEHVSSGHYWGKTLLPFYEGGVMTSDLRSVRIYDNGGKTFDRYTAIFIQYPERTPGMFACLGMSGRPFQPQGYGQHGTAMPGAHLGRRIQFETLPLECRRAIMRDLGGDL